MDEMIYDPWFSVWNFQTQPSFKFHWEILFNAQTHMCMQVKNILINMKQRKFDFNVLRWNKILQTTNLTKYSFGQRPSKIRCRKKPVKEWNFRFTEVKLPMMVITPMEWPWLNTNSYILIVAHPYLLQIGYSCKKSYESKMLNL